MTSSLVIAAATGALFGLDGITWWCVVAFVALVIVLGVDHHRHHQQPSLTEPVEHHHVTVLGPVPAFHDWADETDSIQISRSEWDQYLSVPGRAS